MFRLTTLTLLIGSATCAWAQDDSLTFGLSDPIDPALMDPRFADDPPGTLVELCPQADTHIGEIARRIATHGGLALIVDYGGWRSQGDTLQALRAHAFDDPLTHPGQADLTAHVDFQALAAASDTAFSYTTQGALLTALGLPQRSAQLAARLSGAQLTQHLATTRRLTAPEEMGQLFKAIAVFPSSAPLPPGFA